MKTYSKSRIELQNPQNAGKIKSVFCLAKSKALSAKKLGCYLEYCRSQKNMIGKLVVVVNTEGHSI